MFNPVMFVSLGPGDPGLITLKGLKTLQSADTIFCPSTVLLNGRTSSRAKDILLQLGIEQHKISLFDVPMNKNRSLAIESYNTIASIIAEQYKNGKNVAVTAEGDAGFYSTTYYVSENLQAINIPVSRIAGIPAFIACGTLANIHIAGQDEELHIIPGIISLEELGCKLKEGKSVVVMKASQCEPVIKEAIKAIPNALFHYFENVGISNKEFYTSGKDEIISRQFPYFSLIIIQNKL